MVFPADSVLSSYYEERFSGLDQSEPWTPRSRWWTTFASKQIVPERQQLSRGDPPSPPPQPPPSPSRYCLECKIQNDKELSGTATSPQPNASYCHSRGPLDITDQVRQFTVAYGHQ
ncbi:hypothetical protein K490DRAFT_62212 [Saccharata proteae CBS 121410]|uniref:Uncharacterized protein n=1 Tax=Saccharata proteae CBS 121410 TaxID=1314787 RepID=A0A9P4LXS4_9PEZI|nr:hypothetical protein K490DRAFT_62212 [Saccharata proteae CBS 121410]